VFTITAICVLQIRFVLMLALVNENIIGLLFIVYDKFITLKAVG